MALVIAVDIGCQRANPGEFKSKKSRLGFSLDIEFDGIAVLVGLEDIRQQLFAGSFVPGLDSGNGFL